MTGTAGGEPLRVEETRRRVARMVVEETGQRKTASSMMDTVAGKAREGWAKIKKMLEGKRISRDSGKLVVEGGGVGNHLTGTVNGKRKSWAGEFRW